MVMFSCLVSFAFTVQLCFHRKKRRKELEMDWLKNEKTNKKEGKYRLRLKAAEKKDVEGGKSGEK